MMASPESQHMRSLLTEAVTTLCRSGVAYSSNVRVEALIVVTVDERDIIVVNVNETIDNDSSDECLTEKTVTDQLKTVQTKTNSQKRKFSPKDQNNSKDYSQSPKRVRDADETVSYLVETAELSDEERESQIKLEPTSDYEDEDETDPFTLFNEIVTAGDETESDGTPTPVAVFQATTPSDNPPSGAAISEETSKASTSKNTESNAEDCGEWLQTSKCRPKGKKVICAECGAEFSSCTRLREHVQGHHRGGLQCSECGKSFTSQNGIRFHMKKHQGIYNHLCSVCGRKFLMKNDYLAHMNGHLGQKPYLCAACGKCFQSNTSLHHHRKVCGKVREKAPQPETWNCDECSAQFMLKKQLREHKEGLHQDARYECACGKQIKWRSTFQRHKLKCAMAQLIRKTNCDS